jgi:hypothetical protein
MTISVDFYAKVGETFSPRATLIGVTGAAQDLTTASGVTISMRPKGGGTAVYDHLTCTVVSAAAGTVSFDSASVIAFAAGYYDFEFDVTFAGGLIHTFPSNGFFTAKISEQAA